MSLPDWGPSEIAAISGRAVLKFWAPWCGPCKALAPVVSAAAADHPDVAFGQVNLDDQPELALRYRVRSIPTVIGVENGAVMWTQVGAVPAAVLEQRIARWS